MSEIVNIYCDESCHLERDKQPVMLLGGIWCPFVEVKTYVWLKDYDYLVILKKYRDGGRRLITSFWIEYQNFRNKLEKKYMQRIK